MEGKDTPASRVRLKQIRESSLNARALVAERQGLAIRFQFIRQTYAVLLGLNLISSKGLAFLFRLDDTGWSPIYVEQVIREPIAGLKRKLPDGDTAACTDISRLA